jgi:hypothetical protein
VCSVSDTEWRVLFAFDQQLEFHWTNRSSPALESGEIEGEVPGFGRYISRFDAPKLKQPYDVVLDPTTLSSCPVELRGSAVRPLRIGRTEKWEGAHPDARPDSLWLIDVDQDEHTPQLFEVDVSEPDGSRQRMFTRRRRQVEHESFDVFDL